MKERKGSTLVEVVVSVLLTAVMVGAVFSVALTAKGEGKITEAHNAASQCMSQLSRQLKSYVTAYYSYSSGGFISSMSEIGGPSSPASPGPASWTWAPLGISDSCGSGCYALSVGVHNLSGFCLPGWVMQPPYNASLSYTVSVPAANEGPQVFVSVNWNNPNP